MKDPELREDQNLQPYQGELFPKKEKISNKKIPDYKTRGDIRGRSSLPFNTINKPGWLQQPSGEIEIDYDKCPAENDV
jgi:hypothetical protein